jgi:hypothetical protein
MLVFAIVSKPSLVLGTTLPYVEWVPGDLSTGLKQLGHRGDHSSPSSAEHKTWPELYLHKKVRARSEL